MIDLLPDLKAAGEGLLRWVLWMNVWCGAMLAAAAIADRLMSRRVAASWRILLFAAVLARLAIPPALESPIGLSSPGPATIRVSLGGPGAEPASPVGVERSAQPAIAGARTHAGMSAAQFAVPVYALGALVLAGAWLAGSRRMARVLRESCESGLRIAGGVPVLRHEAMGPVLIGTWRPRLVIPADLERRAGSASLGWVLRHESAHVRRGDPVAAALVHTVVVIAWPIAAAWIAAARIRGLMEEACDDRALRGEGATAREEYGRTLIDLATKRGGVMSTPALSFGAGLRSRVRALRSGKRWPRGVQRLLAVAAAGALVACTGTRNGGEAQNGMQTRIEQAEAEPFKGSLPIRVTILRSWPRHASLDFGAEQSAEGAAGGERSMYRVLTREEFAEVLLGATAADARAVVSRPRLEVIPGLTATVSIGVDHRAGTPINGMMLDSTVTLVEIPANSAEHVYTMDLAFARFGDKKEAARSSVKQVKVPQGRTVAMLATGALEGERLLVCVSPGPDRTETRFGDAAEPPQPLIADPRPLIEFTAKIHRVDAPKDYGSPKGHGPRKRWSAYPGGAELGAAEFAAFMKELVSRPGYSLLAAPRVWVYPEQDATIEMQPEPDTPGAVQTIRLRGVRKDGVVECTGAYSRTAKGITTEGSWNRARRIEPGGAMVWSIHDPELGAWYTVTIQAEVHEPGSIEPQTSTTLDAEPG